MKFAISIAAALVITLFVGCSATVPIRPWMFIQNEAQPDVTNPVHSEQEVVLPG